VAPKLTPPEKHLVRFLVPPKGVTFAHSCAPMRSERFGKKRVFTAGAQKSAQVRSDLVRLCSHKNAGVSGEGTSAQNPIGLCACAPLRGEVCA